MAATMVHIRVDRKTKQKAAKTLADMGLSRCAYFWVGRGNGKRLNSAGALFKELGI